jgi:protein disulfide-isomerase A1
LDTAARFDDIQFALVGEDATEVRTKYGIGKDETIAISVNDFEGEENLIKMDAKLAETSAADFQKWVSAHSLPLVVTFSQETAPRIFRGDLKTHYLLFADGEDEGAGAAALKEFRASASAAKGSGKALFVVVPSSEDRVMGYFGITAKDTPTAVLVNMNDSGMKKFKYTGGMAQADFDAFLADHVAGKLKPFLKSDDAPSAEAEASEPVKTIVGTNFEAIALDTKKDVLLEIYAPWCGHCKQLAPIYEKLGKAVSSAKLDDKVVIAKMDGTTNEVDFAGVAVKGFPTIYFFPAGDAKAAMEYDGSRDLDGFIAFLQKHATNDVSALADAEDDE